MNQLKYHTAYDTNMIPTIYTYLAGECIYRYSIINNIWISIFFIALIYPTLQSIPMRCLKYKIFLNNFSGKFIKEIYPYIILYHTILPEHDVSRQSIFWIIQILLLQRKTKTGNKLKFPFDSEQTFKNYCFEIQGFKFETDFVR